MSRGRVGGGCYSQSGTCAPSAAQRIESAPRGRSTYSYTGAPGVRVTG